MLQLVIPPAWTALLLRIREVCPSAVMAGGALRDLDNGKEVKDLDVFIQADGWRQVDRDLAALVGAGFQASFDETCETGGAYPEDQNLEVVQIAELLEHGLDLPVQLIFVNWDTARITDRFDYGICRLSWDGAFITRTVEYDEDKAAKVFRLRRDRPTPVSMRGSIRRYARLSADKYAGWDWWPYEDPDPFGLPADL